MGDRISRRKGEAMKTLSIRQPWAWLIVNGHKNIENRAWSTKYRGEILIHASIKIDRDAYTSFKHQYSDMPFQANLKRGGIVGKVSIVDCLTESDSKWFDGKYGFVLENPMVVPFFPCKGKLSFFEVDYPEDWKQPGPAFETVSAEDAKLGITGLEKQVYDFVSKKIPQGKFIADSDLRQLFGELDSSWNSVLNSDVLRDFRTRDRQHDIWWGNPKDLYLIVGPYDELKGGS